jgi:hypothetical protein
MVELLLMLTAMLLLGLRATHRPRAARARRDRMR